MLKYQFPAVKGCQAGKDYYICMVPLGLMSKIFVTDSSDVPAEYRAQRKLNEARIPEICGYILSNRDSYVWDSKKRNGVYFRISGMNMKTIFKRVDRIEKRPKNC